MEGHLRPVDIQEFPTWCRLCPCFVMFIPLWEGTFFHPCFTFLVWPSAVIPYYPKFYSLTLFLTLIKIPRSRTGTIAYVNICTWNQAYDQHSYAFWKKKENQRSQRKKWMQVEVFCVSHRQNAGNTFWGSTVGPLPTVLCTHICSHLPHHTAFFV